MSLSSSSLPPRRDDTKTTLTTESNSDCPPRKKSSDSDVDIAKVCVILINRFWVMQVINRCKGMWQTGFVCRQPKSGTKGLVRK